MNFFDTLTYNVLLFLGSGVSVEPDNHWGSQINQLEQLVDKMECEVCNTVEFLEMSNFSF